MLPIPRAGYEINELMSYNTLMTVNNVLLNRIQTNKKNKKKLRQNQNGFRQGLLITSHILVLRRIIVEVK